MYARSNPSPGQSPDTSLEGWTHGAWREDWTGLLQEDYTSVFELHREIVAPSSRPGLVLLHHQPALNCDDDEKLQELIFTIYYLLPFLYIVRLHSRPSHDLAQSSAPSPKPADKIPFPHARTPFLSRALQHAPLNPIAAADIPSSVNPPFNQQLCCSEPHGLHAGGRGSMHI